MANLGYLSGIWRGPRPSACPGNYDSFSSSSLACYEGTKVHTTSVNMYRASLEQGDLLSGTSVMSTFTGDADMPSWAGHVCK